MDDLIELLSEAKDQLMEMYKVADDSAADYVLEIQTAVNFIDKALRTQDRLDIFKALQKAHNTLEREYNETPADEEYDDLVDRLAEPLQGLQERIMKKSAIKKIITEAVLKSLNESPASDDVENKLRKLFGLSPNMIRNIQSLTVEEEPLKTSKSIILHDKKGDKIVLLRGASLDFIKRYLPSLTNLVSTLSKQKPVTKSDEEIDFS
jgi:hypothetical protein